MIHLERYFKGIEGLPLILVASNALVYIFELMNPGLVSSLVLSPSVAQSGEYWRFLTFLFVPPPMSAFFLFFWLYLLYLYAEALETEWGCARFSAYYLVGAAATAAVGFIPAWGVVPNIYLNTSLFLAFAALFPDFELLVFFFIPLKVKYLGYFTWAWMAWSFYGGSSLDRWAIAAALLAYILFMGPSLWQKTALRVHSWKRRGQWE
jgi:hypothetical protein